MTLLLFVWQVQATVMSSLASLVALGLGAWSKGSFDLQKAAVLSASGVTTAFISALTLGQRFILLICSLSYNRVLL